MLTNIYLKIKNIILKSVNSAILKKNSQEIEYYDYNNCNSKV